MKVVIAGIGVLIALVFSAPSIFAQEMIGMMTRAQCVAQGGIPDSSLTDRDNPDPPRPCRRGRKDEPKESKAPSASDNACGESCNMLGQLCADTRAQCEARSRQCTAECRKTDATATIEDGKTIEADKSAQPPTPGCKPGIRCDEFTCVTVVCNLGLGWKGVYGGIRDMDKK